MAETSAAVPRPQDRSVWMLCLFIGGVTLIRFVHLFATPIPLGFDEAQYWTWAQDFSFGYFSKPPLIAWAIAGTTALCGDGEGCVRAFAPLSHAVTAVFAFLLGRDLFNDRVGAWAAASYIVMPGVSLGAMLASTDALLLPCWAAALWALNRALKSEETRWWIVAGFAAGLGLLAKYAMVYLWLGGLVWFLWSASRPKVWPGAALASGLAFLIYSPNLIWNAVNGWPSYVHTGANANLSGDLFNPLQALEFFAGQFAVFGPVLMVILLIVIWRLPSLTGERSQNSSAYRFCFAFGLPVLGLILAQSFLSRAHANWAAVAYVPFVVAVSAWLLETSRTLWLKLSLALHLAVASIVYNMDALRSLVPSVPDPAAELRGWPAAGAWLTDVMGEHPDRIVLFEDRATMGWMLYYADWSDHEAVMWNPKRQTLNHYEMTTDLAGRVGADVVFVQRLYDPARLAPYFSSMTPAGTFASDGDRPVKISLFTLDDFQGYEQ